MNFGYVVGSYRGKYDSTNEKRNDVEDITLDTVSGIEESKTMKTNKISRHFKRNRSIHSMDS